MKKPKCKHVLRKQKQNKIKYSNEKGKIEKMAITKTT